MQFSEKDLAMMGSMNRFRKLRLSCLHPDFGKPEVHMLRLIVESGDSGIKVSELAKALEAPVPAISRGLGSMEEKGLIARTIDKQDRRNIIVTATQRGIDTDGSIGEAIHGFWEEVFEEIPDEDYFKMIKGWNLLMDRMEEVLERRKSKGGET